MIYMIFPHPSYIFFFFNDTATTEIYTLSLHDALPIWRRLWTADRSPAPGHTDHRRNARPCSRSSDPANIESRESARSEEHTSELQSQSNLVCRLLLEKKKRNNDAVLRRDIQLNHHVRT